MKDPDRELTYALAKIGGEFRPNELAYLASTSEVEASFLDRLAYRLHLDYEAAGYIVAREWNRVDLAILDAKACEETWAVQETDSCLSESIFDFWAEAPRGSKIHPRDAECFRRNIHSDTLRLDCLPCAFNGPLRKAKLVLLFLNPGFHDSDVQHAESEDGKDLYLRQWTGSAALPTRLEHEAAMVWASSILKQFGLAHADVRSTCSIMNLLPYHSASFKDPILLSALPSSRATVDWAQGDLFKRAQREEVVVVCLRSARQWGLCRGMTPEGYLFAPAVGRGGHLPKAGGERDAVINAIRHVFKDNSN